VRRAAFVAVFILGTAVAADEEKHASFTCRGFSERKFCCVAKNVEKWTPEWRIYAGAEVVPDKATGQSVCFDAPLEWKWFEMRVVDDGGNEHIVRALVRRDVAEHKVIFARGWDE
jgi:hypothetical protein